jgi:hypothetical protein
MWLNAWGVFCFANRCRQTQVAARIADCGVGDPAYDLRENDFSAGRCYPVGAKNSSAMLSGSRNDRTDP